MAPSTQENRDPTAEDPLTVLARFYEAELAYLAAGGPSKASFADVARHLDPEVVLHQAAGLPYGGEWRGPDGLERFFVAMSETWELFEFRKQELAVSGDSVFALTEIHARSRATGRELDFPILQRITMKDGRLAEIWPFYWDTAAIAAACSPERTTR